MALKRNRNLYYLTRRRRSLRGGAGRTVSSSIIVSRNPPVRSLIKLKIKHIKTFIVDPARAKTRPQSAYPLKICFASNVKVSNANNSVINVSSFPTVPDDSATPHTMNPAIRKIAQRHA